MADVSDRLSRSMTSYRAKVSITPLPITASAVIGISSRRKHRYWAERTVESCAIRTSANRFRMSPTTTKNIACSVQSVFHASIDIHHFCNLSRRKHRCWAERNCRIVSNFEQVQIGSEWSRPRRKISSTLGRAKLKTNSLMLIIYL